MIVGSGGKWYSSEEVFALIDKAKALGLIDADTNGLSWMLFNEEHISIDQLRQMVESRQ